ncbi:late competence protein ComER [Gracilibacillus halophilus YIM-C55.5]|uniref:Late competence protein ComER n=2 Tax=Gracilibacillus TaxID=74385 RepID=N4WB81_9BACI|nr:late competence protein ComER [Gracilibacillus halophilus]ENH97533.1 late competence protein ComER [Gracilibacillus halophilus YIM-C55.5]
MKWGIIGTGNMGEVITHAFIQSNVIDEADLFITNRTLAKAQKLQTQYPRIQVVESTFDVIQKVDTIFLCVKPRDMVNVLHEAKTILKDHQLLVSITSGISVDQLEQLVNCRVARMVPSITNRALGGVSLITFGSRMNKKEQDTFIHQCSQFSEPFVIDENIIRISSDMVSCGPAFFSYLAERYIHDAQNQTSISQEHATLLMEKMFIGFGKLLEQKHFTLDELIEKVCVTGGITGVGIEALEERTDDLFQHLIQATHGKFYEEKNKVQTTINSHTPLF